MKTSLDDLYVIADYGYHGEPSTDGYAYSTKEAAQAIVDEVKKDFPKLRRYVKDLQDFIWECRRTFMSCRHECYQIGGPWIGANPNCPVHRPGGTQDQEDRIDALEARIEDLEERLALLERWGSD